MKARLKRTFIHRGRRYRRGTHEFPDDTPLPRDAEVLEEETSKKSKSKDEDKNQGKLL